MSANAIAICWPGHVSTYNLKNFLPEFFRIEQLREQERVRHAINQIAKKTKAIEKGGEVSFQINDQFILLNESVI